MNNKVEINSDSKLWYHDKLEKFVRLSEKPEPPPIDIELVDKNFRITKTILENL